MARKKNPGYGKKDQKSGVICSQAPPNLFWSAVHRLDVGGQKK